MTCMGILHILKPFNFPNAPFVSRQIFDEFLIPKKCCLINPISLSHTHVQLNWTDLIIVIHMASKLIEKKKKKLTDWLKTRHSKSQKSWEKFQDLSFLVALIPSLRRSSSTFWQLLHSNRTHNSNETWHWRHNFTTVIITVV